MKKLQDKSVRSTGARCGQPECAYAQRKETGEIAGAEGRPALAGNGSPGCRGRHALTPCQTGLPNPFAKSVNGRTLL